MMNSYLQITPPERLTLGEYTYENTPFKAGSDASVVTTVNFIL